MTIQPSANHTNDPVEYDPTLPRLVKCTATTASGKPCQAWEL